MFRDFFRDFARNLGRCFRGYNLILQFVAAALTYVAVMSGFDWLYFESTRSELLRTYTIPAAILGFFVPIVVPVGLYLAGEWRRKPHLRLIAAALAQAAMMGWALSSFYKAFTGRIQPEFYTHLSDVDISHQFNFGFWKHGIFWGWPSSHTAVAFALAFSLWYLFPKNATLRYSGMLFALYIGFGVSVSIHWFSDFVAGAIVGAVVGTVIGKDFAARLRG